MGIESTLVLKALPDGDFGQDAIIDAHRISRTHLRYPTSGGDPEIITRAPCWELRSAPPNEMTPWLGLQLEGLHYAQTGNLGLISNLIG
jgi:hypothetical protein